ncbi:MAG: tRNA (adenosine(37)-N6)-threonylcarbamoyltransferase complex ATPase subunit type 1 TsaE [Elusimicrobia bacterium]|nr:tRNA (adenosine(37)-N6)-threonylcarbamoyltransferase complex ATPase subunit type 1 TsaE [Elusimicrobiota bacterium]
MVVRRISKSPDQTKKIAGIILRTALRLGSRVFFLRGDLGSGKTVFVQGLARALGVKRSVKSPSFVIFQEYQGRALNLVHADCYRLEKPEDFVHLGLDEILDDQKKVLAVEWPQKFSPSWRKRLNFCDIEMAQGRTNNERLIRIGMPI